MADASVKVSGLQELNAGIARLEATVTERLKATAGGYAILIRNRAAEILASKTHGTGRTAGEIRVVEEAARKQFRVESPGDERWPNLPNALEFGTRFMTARPYMRPAADEMSDAYQQGMAKTAEDAAQEILT